MSSAFWRGGLGRTRVTLLPERHSAFVELQEVHAVAPDTEPAQLLELVLSKLVGIDWKFAEVCSPPHTAILISHGVAA